MPIFSRFAVDRRDERPLLRLAGFLFDDRRQRHELPHARARVRAAPRAQLRRQRLLESGDHPRDELRGGRVPRQRVRVREQIAFEIAGARDRTRDRAARSRRPRRTSAARPNPFDSNSSPICLIVSPSGNVIGQRDRRRRARSSQSTSRTRHRAIESVLAGLQTPAGAAAQRARAGSAAVADDAGVDQPPADRRRAGALRNLDELLRRVVALVGRSTPAETTIRAQRARTSSDEDEHQPTTRFTRSSSSIRRRSAARRAGRRDSPGG